MNRRQLMAASLAALCGTVAPLASAGLADDESEIVNDEFDSFAEDSGFADESEGLGDSATASNETSDWSSQDAPSPQPDSNRAANPGTTEAAEPVAYMTWQCVPCGLIYDEAKGLPEDGIPPGTRWADVPDTWTCPDCGVTKADFEMTPA